MRAGEVKVSVGLDREAEGRSGGKPTGVRCWRAQTVPASGQKVVLVSFLHQRSRGVGEEGTDRMSTAPFGVWLGQEGRCK